MLLCIIHPMTLFGEQYRCQGVCVWNLSKIIYQGAEEVREKRGFAPGARCAGTMEDGLRTAVLRNTDLMSSSSE